MKLALGILMILLGDLLFLTTIYYAIGPGEVVPWAREWVCLNLSVLAVCSAICGAWLIWHDMERRCNEAMRRRYEPHKETFRAS